MDQQGDQQAAYHTGVWAPPNLLAKAKSDENERTKAESWGSNTPWAYRPGEFVYYQIRSEESVLGPDPSHANNYRL